MILTPIRGDRERVDVASARARRVYRHLLSTRLHWQAKHDAESLADVLEGVARMDARPASPAAAACSRRPRSDRGR